MASGNSIIRQGTRSTFITSMFIISLVLFFLSLFAAGAIYSNMQLEKAQEDFVMMISLPDYTSTEKREGFVKFLQEQPFVKKFEYISKDEAAARFIKEFGDDHLGILDGMNPLPASYNMSLNLPYVNPDSIVKVNEILARQEFISIKEPDYPIEEIEQLKSNIRDFIKTAIAVGIIVSLIAFFIVNSTIRLAIYGKRLVIRSMQLIGATNGFIRGPFVKMGLWQGIAGAVMANILLFVLIGLLSRLRLGLDDLNELIYRSEFLFLLGGIVIFGALLGWMSSSWAVNRFLNKNLDQLM